MAKNKKGMKKTPKKGATVSGVGLKKKLKGTGSRKPKKILKQKLRRGFGDLSASQVSTPKGAKTPKKLASKLVTLTPKFNPPSTVTAPSSFGSVENSPITRQAVSRNPNVREMFKNPHMVLNMGLKRKRTDRFQTVSLKVNCIKSEIINTKNVKMACADEEMEKVNDDIKKTVEKVFDGPVPSTPRTIIKKNGDVFMNPAANSSNDKDIDEQKDIDNDENGTVLLDDSTDTSITLNTNNLDSSQNDLQEEPVIKNVWQLDSSKILFPETPPPPQWKGALNTPAPPKINDSLDAPPGPLKLPSSASSAPQNTFSQPEMDGLSDSTLLLCGLCKEICKRGIKLDCCEARACRACAIKEITSTRSCWACPTLGVTSDNLINDNLLRTAVEQFKNRNIVLPAPPGPLSTPAPPQINAPGTLNTPAFAQINSTGPQNAFSQPQLTASVDTPDPPRWKGPLNTPLKSDNDAIVIEDDKQSNPIEDLGEEMLDFVNEEAFSQLVGVQVPATPRTLLKQMDLFKDDIKYSSDESEKNEEDDIIVIDDIDNDFDVDEDSDLEIIEEVSGTKSSNIKPMTTTNIQNVTDRYKPPSQDFIGFEIDTRPGEMSVGPMKKQQQQQGRRTQDKELTKRWKEMRKNKVGRKKFGKEHINTQPLPNLVAGLGGPSNMMEFMLQSNLKINEGAGPSNFPKNNLMVGPGPHLAQTVQRNSLSNEDLARVKKKMKQKNNLMVGPDLLQSNQGDEMDRLVAAFPLPKKTNQRDFVSLSKKKKVKRLNGGNGGQGSRENKPGDWTCSCGNYNFAWRAQCNQCKNLRDAKMGQVMAPPRPKSPKPIQNVGPTMFVPEGGETVKSGLRPIVIDGSNVAMGHGRHVTFSPRGIEICIQYFKKRGHTTIIAFLPQHRQGHDGELFGKLEREGNVIFTPSRNVQGKRMTSYDDRFIIEYAHGHGGVIVSRDNYRDILEEKPEWREAIEERLLMPTWVADTIMFPSDPLGPDGPTLDQFLKF